MMEVCTVTTEQRAAVRARCDAATPGPWAWVEEGGNVSSPDDDGAIEVGLLVSTSLPQYQFDDHDRPFVFSWTWVLDAKARSDTIGVKMPDACFIAHARTDLPAALDEIDRLEALLRAHGIDPAAPATATA
jgi:hypothetical protein